MHTRPSMLLTACLFVIPLVAQDIALDRHLVQLADEQWFAATNKADHEQIAPMLSEDFRSIAVAGYIFTKASALDAYREIATDPMRRSSWEHARAEYRVVGREIQIIGDVAIVTGTAERAGQRGHRFTNIWVRTNDTWLLRLTQMTLIFPAERDKELIPKSE